MPEDVMIITTRPRQLAVAMNQGTAAEIAPIVRLAFGTVADHLARLGRPPDGPAIARYTLRDDGSFDIAAGFAVDEPFEGDGIVEPLSLPAAEVATTTFVGTFPDLPLGYERLRTGVTELGRRLDEAAPVWEEYPDPATPADEARVDIFWPLLPA